MTQSEASQVNLPVQQPSANAVNITYDKLFELLRAERNSSSLVQLPASFFADVRSYLSLKQDSINKNRNSSDIFAAEHIETTSQQVRNALKILADIIDRRERKILSLALNKARASSSTVDVSYLLVEEKAFFSQIVTLLAAQRNTLQQLLSPSVATSSGSISDASPKASTATVLVDAATVQVAAEKSYEVVEDISEFFGPDMKHYGPYAINDKVALSDQIARILLKKGFVKQI